jgi:hypothetical protein
LLLYAAASSQVYNTVLVVEQEKDPKVAKPKAGGCSEQPSSRSPPPEEAAEEPLQASGAAPARHRLVQRPIYFISTVLRDARLRYLQVQKLLLGVFLALRKLQHYFESHRITVVISVLPGSSVA